MIIAVAVIAVLVLALGAAAFAVFVKLMRAAGGKGITYTGYADFRKGW